MLVALIWENILKDTPYHSEKGNTNKKHSEILSKPIRITKIRSIMIPSVGEVVKL